MTTKQEEARKRLIMVAGSATELTMLLHVLQHALGRDEYGENPHGREDYRNHFCTGEGSEDFALCREAVAQGLMREYPPSEISGGDHVFTVTDAGKAYITEYSPPRPRRTRGQERYRKYLDSAAADCGMTFGEWLRREAN